MRVLSRRLFMQVAVAMTAAVAAVTASPAPLEVEPDFEITRTPTGFRVKIQVPWGSPPVLPYLRDTLDLWPSLVAVRRTGYVTYNGGPLSHIPVHLFHSVDGEGSGYLVLRVEVADQSTYRLRAATYPWPRQALGKSFTPATPVSWWRGEEHETMVTFECSVGPRPDDTIPTPRPDAKHIVGPRYTFTLNRS